MAATDLLSGRKVLPSALPGAVTEKNIRAFFLLLGTPFRRNELRHFGGKHSFRCGNSRVGEFVVQIVGGVDASERNRSPFCIRGSRSVGKHHQNVNYKPYYQPRRSLVVGTA